MDFCFRIIYIEMAIRRDSMDNSANQLEKHLVGHIPLPRPDIDENGENAISHILNGNDNTSWIWPLHKMTPKFNLLFLAHDPSLHQVW